VHVYVYTCDNQDLRVCVYRYMCVCVCVFKCVCVFVYSYEGAKLCRRAASRVFYSYNTLHTQICACVCTYMYAVATISRRLKIIGLFGKRAL